MSAPSAGRMAPAPMRRTGPTEPTCWPARPTSCVRRTELRAELTPGSTSNLTAAVRAVAAEGGVINEGNMEVLREWNRTLADAGWAAPAWPEEYGGRAASVPEQLAWLEVMSAAGAPGPVNVIGVANIAPAIMAVGTDEQRGRYLRPMLRGDEIWCQGMSEPDAGSDLASLRTSARQDGETFVVNGQKTWNSLGRLRRLVPALRPHRSRRAQAQGHQLPPGRHAVTRGGGTPAPHHGRGPHLLRALLHRRRRPQANLLGNAQRGLAGGHHHLEPRAGRRGPAAPGPAGAARTG